jgi:hypothetical protein
MAELWSKDDQHVERMFYGGNRLAKAIAVFDAAVKHRPHRRYTVRKGTHVIRKWPDE